MPVKWEERIRRREVEAIFKTLDAPTMPDIESIRDEAIKAFASELDGRLASLQPGEALQVSFFIDILTEEGKVRGGKGARSASIPGYTAWRAVVLERDEYTCQHCGRQDGELHAHHIKPWAEFPGMRFDVSNGVTLCRKCHAKEHPEVGILQNGATD